MNRIFRDTLCTLILMSSSAVALATPIATQLDKLIGYAAMGNSSDANELAQLVQFSGVKDLAINVKMDATKATIIAAPDLTNTWILTDLTQPGYFALKFGTGGTGATANTFFFENTGDLTQLVWSDQQVQNLTGVICKTANDCKVERLSHYAATKPVATTTTPTPTPTTPTTNPTTPTTTVDPVPPANPVPPTDPVIPGFPRFPEMPVNIKGPVLQGGQSGGGAQEVNDVPEPGSLALLALGALAVAGTRGRRAR